MGISGSRGKKVAPASVTEGHPSTQTLQRQASSVSVSQKNTPKKCLSNNRRVTQSAEDDRNLADEVDRILEACETTEDRRKGFPLYICEKYSFCYNQRDEHGMDAGNTLTADVILPTDLLKSGSPEDRKDICTLNQLKKLHKQTAVTELRGDPVYTKAAQVPCICDDISLALPVSYDASEEDLMSAIEKEFG